MQRGELWIGDFYHSDLVVASLSEVGVELFSETRMLDYGGSSGSMVRVLSAVFPKSEFVACDPIKSSIDWAQNNLARDNLWFYHQSQVPPLPFNDSEFDVVSGISIWSHHGVNAAKIWFDEVSRILKPGGTLIFTTHGVGSILHYTEQALKPVVRFKELYAGYLNSGFAFEEVWINEDDVGNSATEFEWGHSYYEPKTIAALLQENFKILKINLRANQKNQDVYIARKS